MSTGFEFEIKNTHPTATLHFVVMSNWNCLDTDFIDPPGFATQPFDIPAGQSKVCKLYRKDGHGCDGRQGTFTMQLQWIVPGTPIDLRSQAFSFDSHGQIGFEGTWNPPTYTAYASRLEQSGPGARATWTITPLVEPSIERKIALIAAHAPMVYLAQGEPYRPCSVEWAFQYLTRQLRDGTYWLYTKADLSPQDDSLPLFAGQPVTSNPPPIYAFWVKKTGGFFDICYFTYYGYNRGKSAAGKYYGNHVSDWEHVTVRLNGFLESTQVYFSAHEGGELVNWPDVEKINGRPVAYSAWGSHGLYAHEGSHSYEYFAFAPTLSDSTSKGDLWDTASNVKMYDWDQKAELVPSSGRGPPEPDALGNVPKDMYMDTPVISKGGAGTPAPPPAPAPPPTPAMASTSGWPKWMSTDYGNPGPNPADPASGPIYRWGNGHNGGPLAGQYELEDGPTGPVDKGDCWDPNKFA